MNVRLALHVLCCHATLLGFLLLLLLLLLLLDIQARCGRACLRLRLTLAVLLLSAVDGWHLALVVEGYKGCML